MKRNVLETIKEVCIVISFGACAVATLLLVAFTAYMVFTTF